MNLGYCAVGTVVLTILTMILYHVIKNDWTFNKNIWKEILISLILSAAVITIMSAVILFKDTQADANTQKDVNLMVENIIEGNTQVEEISQKPVISSPESKVTFEPVTLYDEESTPVPEDLAEDEVDDETDIEAEDETDSEEESTILTDVTYGEDAEGNPAAESTPSKEPSPVIVPEISVDINSPSYAYHDFIGTDSILPESSIREYDLSELQNLDAKACVLARNEIYARHGRVFTNEDLMAYFSAKSWYTPSVPADEFSNSVLTAVEKHNKDLIVSYEKQMGYK